ncbi:leucine-rich repeat protein SHOC2, partial [Schistosoma bovis]
GSKLISDSKSRLVLDLSSLGLDSVSPDIGSLSHLIELFLYDNKLTCLPLQIGLLKNLQRVCRNLVYFLSQLWLQENSLTFLPDELGYCSKLTHLDIRHNRLEGCIPVVITKFTLMKQLYLTYNKLTDISAIGNLCLLQTLVVKSNQLQGPIPDCIGNLTQLKTLDLSKNRLTKITESSYFVFLHVFNSLFNVFTCCKKYLL